MSTEHRPALATGMRTPWGWIAAYPLPFVALAGLLGGLVLVYVAGLADVGGYVWLGTLLIGGLPLVYATVRRLLRREFASDVIATLAIVGAIALDQPFAGAIIVLMQSGGEAIEEFAHRRATASLERLSRLAPRWAYRYTSRGVERVYIESVVPGDRLAIRRGDILPVDGTVASAAATIDDSAVTGEALPRTRTTGETVLSGSANVGAAFDLAAVRPSRESQYARIVELVRTAQTQKPAIQRIADRYATWFTPTTVVIAVLAAYLDRNPLTGLAVLVVATPCPLILATPIAVLRGINRAADQGIVVKSGAALEEMARAQVVLFDKTGTLTAGRPEVERVVPLTGRSTDEILRLSAAVEQFSSHPLADAVARLVPAAVLSSVSNHHEFSGAGVAGTVDGHRVVVGCRGLCASVARRPLDEEWERVRGTGAAPGRLISFVLVDGSPVGALLFEDHLRPEVPGLAGRLRRLGVREVGLVTGDNRQNADDVARRAGIATVRADLLPEQKVECVGELRRRYGSTVMVGDGINDAAALATASVGVAMGARGAGIAAEAADVVLVVDNVGRIVEGISLGQRMLSVARQGILFGLGTSLVLMGIASFGYIAPADGAVIQEALDITVIFNALRVR